MSVRQSTGSSRREFLKAAGATLCLSPGVGSLLAADATPAKYRRLNLTDKACSKNLVSYEKAVSEMLKLPPEDPRNWYRHALIHTLDCPHGNWWFLPWHRGYIGWFEKICRDLSKDPDFALPYWDWTELPELPSAFLKGSLNPANFTIASYVDFKKAFDPVVSNLYKTLTPAQLKQLTLREFPTAEDLWMNLAHDPPNDMTAESMFSDISFVRAVNPPHSRAFDAKTSNAVALATVLDAIGPRIFEDFGSHKALIHSLPSTSGVLESQPHNLVHNYVGGFDSGPPKRQGFMRDFLSPVDPIFFMHHSNIDRLWDVWTRKQLAIGAQLMQPANYPTTPTGDDLAAWKSEPFLFFIGPDGKPVAQQSSGDYTSTSFFEYDYQPGSGEVTVPVTPPTPHKLAGNSFMAAMISSKSSITDQAVGTARVPDTLSTSAGGQNGLRVVAVITVELPAGSRDMELHVLVNTDPKARSVSFLSPHYAGTYQVFGSHAHGKSDEDKNTVTFSMGLTDSIRRLSSRKLLTGTDDIKVSVIATVPGVAIENRSVNVTKIVLKTY